MKVVIGLGTTGLSVVRYLRAQAEVVVVMDSALEPEGAVALRAEYPEVCCFFGGFNRDVLDQAEEVIVSPGVSLRHPDLGACVARKCVVGDIELFARHVRVAGKPISVYGVTGSNGKTTVTTLLGQMAAAAGVHAAVAGNIGPPVLSCLEDKLTQCYILELSSFQLETTTSLALESGVVLNVTPDHMDRYDDFEAYRAAKQWIYRNCRTPVINMDAPDIWQGLPLPSHRIAFSVKKSADYCLHEGWLVGHGKRLCSLAEMPLSGEHHWQNALAALAMGEVMGLPLSAMVSVLKNFRGLPHRCQMIREVDGVLWYNDSKGTNIGATETAINTVAHMTPGKVILLAGGLGKGADFRTLEPCLRAHVSHAILLGRDAEILAGAWCAVTQIHRVTTLEEAVACARRLATRGDAVLLSPACASLDMFQNFADRGDQFIAWVNAL